MSKTLKIYLFVFATLIAVMVAVDQTRRKPLDWSPTYYLNEKKPLDLYVFNSEIDHLFGDSVTRYGKSPYEYFHRRDSLDMRKETYLFINESVYFDKSSVHKILDAVGQGSTLFIVSDGFDPYLIDTLGVTCEYAYHGNPVSDKPALRLTFSRKEWDGDEYSYSPVFGRYAFLSADSASATALGYMTFFGGEEYINFMEFRFGKGKIILHNQPVVFTNYALLSGGQSQEYAGRVLSYLPGRPVVWFVASQQQNSGSGESLLRIVFRYPPLRMAWLIFMYGLLVFIIFTAKRKQRVVPVVKPLRNTTVEFVQTIGNLYFQEGDTTDIARKKIIYFLDRVRRTYNIDTQLPGEELIQRLHLRSGKDEELIKEIVSLMGDINSRNRCGRQELIRLSLLMDRFWG